LASKSLVSGVFLSAGSRDGDREENLRAGLARLAAAGRPVLRVSSLYETEPVDLPGQRTVLNIVAEVRDREGPRSLLEACLAAERGLGRLRSGGPGPDTGPRPLDLDILFYQGRILREPGLIVPHPRLHLRRFVLEPLAELAPELVHPVLDAPVRRLRERCADTAWVRIVAAPERWWDGGSR